MIPSHGAYAQALSPFGVSLRHLPPSLAPDTVAGLVNEADALLVGGAPDLEAIPPEVQRVALQRALERDIPVLAIGVRHAIAELGLRREAA